MSAYIEALEAHNAMHAPDAAKAGKKPSKMSDDRLRSLMRAHGMNMGGAGHG